MTRARLIFLPGLAFLACVSLVSRGAAQSAARPPRAVNLPAVEEKILELVNRERARRGLTALRFSKRLREVARFHSRNMAEFRFFSHVDHQGRRVGERCRQRYPQLLGGFGENIAYMAGHVGPNLATQFVEQWMNSKGHRKNILSRDYDYLGVGVVRKGDRYYATQVFGSLIAFLETELPEKLPYGSRQRLDFTFLGTFPREELSIYVTFPDRKARYFVSDESYYVGGGPFIPTWHGANAFSVDLAFQYGKGVYRLSVGRNGLYFEKGYEIRVF